MEKKNRKKLQTTEMDRFKNVLTKQSNPVIKLGSVHFNYRNTIAF